MLDIKVKAIHTVILERSREDIIHFRVMRTEGVPQEVRKPNRNVFIGDGLVNSSSANGKKDSLSSCLTDGNILPDLVTALEKLGVWVDGTIALVAKVGARPSSDSIGEDIDEAEVDDV